LRHAMLFPMTERLYFRDSFLTEFEATVTSCKKEGDRFRVTLDRTAFYPDSGGQPHDLGMLSGVPVVEVHEAPDGHGVVHYTSAELPPGPVRGTIDWQRRLDHMQQHTAQHLLSAVFLDLFHFSTVSFHLGREFSTIDLAAPNVTQQSLDEAERRANSLIFEDRVVGVRFGTAEELAVAGVRKEVDRKGILRAVEIKGLDLQPCGGTHLASTGQAGLLLIRGFEHRRGAWRISFVAGTRALACAKSDFNSLGNAAELLSCRRSDVPSVLAKSLQEKRAHFAYAKRLEESLARYQAESLLARAARAGSGSEEKILVSAVVENDSPAYLNLLGAKLTAPSGVVALLAGRSTGHVVFRQSKGGPDQMGAMLHEAFCEIEGKGGGNRDVAQGSLRDPSRADDVVAFAKSKLNP
jgi:alanyl-tRNA synthetase